MAARAQAVKMRAIQLTRAAPGDAATWLTREAAELDIELSNDQAREMITTGISAHGVPVYALSGSAFARLPAGDIDARAINWHEGTLEQNGSVTLELGGVSLVVEHDHTLIEVDLIALGEFFDRVIARERRPTKAGKFAHRPRGRPPEHPWEDAVIIGTLAASEDGLWSDPNEVARRMADWFGETHGEIPDMRDIQERAACICTHGRRVLGVPEK
jgi:hypothetical protein